MSKTCIISPELEISGLYYETITIVIDDPS
jgi:hypothetical protein